MYSLQTCRFCKSPTTGRSPIVKYGVRHHAHADCLVKAKGVRAFDKMTDWQCTQFPYLAAVRAGDAIAAELRRRCDMYTESERRFAVKTS